MHEEQEGMMSNTQEEKYTKEEWEGNHDEHKWKHRRRWRRNQDAVAVLAWVS